MPAKRGRCLPWAGKFRIASGSAVGERGDRRGFLDLPDAQKRAHGARGSAIPKAGFPEFGSRSRQLGLFQLAREENRIKRHHVIKSLNRARGLRDERAMVVVVTRLRRSVFGLRRGMRVPGVMMPMTSGSIRQSRRGVKIGVSMRWGGLGVRMMPGAAEGRVQEHHEQHETIGHRGHEGVSPRLWKGAVIMTDSLNLVKRGFFDCGCAVCGRPGAF